MSTSSGQRVTIRQVAHEAGVSTQTVSRVINERPDVAGHTRQRVLDVIERLGYQPNVLARSLSQRRSYMLGVVTAGLKYIGPSRTLNGITRKAGEIGYTLLLKQLAGFEDPDAAGVLNYLMARQVDGIIWAVQEIGGNRTGFDEWLPALPIPIIFLTMEKRPGFNIISVDNYAGARRITAHLLELGHRHIGHIVGPLAWWEARERKRGWEDAMIDAGITPSDQHWAQGNWASASGKAAFAQLLDQFPAMTALFVANDQMALGALQYAHELGLTVPDQLAITGFDNIPESANYWPALTTVDYDHYTLGCRAVQEIVHLIQAQQQDDARHQTTVIAPTKSQLIQPELIIRTSSGGKRVSSPRAPSATIVSEEMA